MPSTPAPRPTRPEWALEIAVMESCSCRVFCQCFFTGQPLPPDAHADHTPVAEHACLFNQAYRVVKGHYQQLSLDAGLGGELVLKRRKGQHPGTVLLQNLSCFGFPRNDGFALMPSVVQAYRTGARAFAFGGTNGFVTTVQMSSDDLAAPSAGKPS